MTFSRYTLHPTVRAALLRFLVHHNPFYLLSALCMVAACLALNTAISPHAGELLKVMALLGTLNLYEAILIVLGLFLIQKRGVIRDGRTLLFIEAPFLFDLMFLNAEAGSASFRYGMLLDVAVLALALIKTAIVLRVLCGRLPRHAFAYIALSLAALFLLPSGFKWIEHRGPITSVHFYFAWCGLGMLLAFWEMHGRLAGATIATEESRVATLIRRLYTALPLASLAAHLGMLHWVYLVPVTAADLSPVVIGLAIAVGRLLPLPLATPIRVVMPLMAILWSLDSAPALHMHLGRIQFTPALVAAGAAYLAYVYCFFLNRAIVLIGGAISAALFIALGPTFAQIAEATESAWQWAIHRIDDVTPKTPIQWGLTALAGAFGFLGLGAAVSFRKEPPAREGFDAAASPVPAPGTPGDG
ncbi:MAG TPA: hypothetical protein VH370_19250 [Humisphaera sp.]|nr:hypothetical protein [Humisphaera sp.]